MGYFPCDIPHMSNEELKKNEINIPKKVTNRERLAKMSNQELAEELCNVNLACTGCLGYELCIADDGRANGLIKWLESEAEEDNDK